MITHLEAIEKIPGGIILSEDDYLLGLFDMTGELMRYAITGMATRGVLPTSDSVSSNEKGRGGILADMRALRMGLEGLNLQGSGSVYPSNSP